MKTEAGQFTSGAIGKPGLPVVEEGRGDLAVLIIPVLGFIGLAAQVLGLAGHGAIGVMAETGPVAKAVPDFPELPDQVIAKEGGDILPSVIDSARAGSGIFAIKRRTLRENQNTPLSKLNSTT